MPFALWFSKNRVSMLGQHNSTISSFFGNVSNQFLACIWKMRRIRSKRNCSKLPIPPKVPANWNYRIINGRKIDNKENININLTPCNLTAILAYLFIGWTTRREMKKMESILEHGVWQNDKTEKRMINEVISDWIFTNRNIVMNLLDQKFILCTSRVN